MRKKWVSAATVIAGAVSMAHGQATSVKSSAVEAFGKGVQIYTCKAAGTDYAWTLKAPEATLSDVKGKLIGKHFAGPTWQANDGSSVAGEPLNVSPSPNAGAIPWIVLHAKSHEGDGVMATVDYVVRTRTEGGVAPSTGCNAGRIDAEVRVPYSAIYLFFRH